MNPKISVIVPVYNTEKYLDRCIQSILAQTYTDFELLLINDGSTDSSGAICDKYVAQDTRVRVFHKENSGVSATRNVGIENSKGSHLIFIDSDDYWYENTVLDQLFATAMTYNLDIIRGEYKAVDEEGNDLFIRPIKDCKKEIANKVIDNFTFLNNAVNGEYFFVLCLVKKEVLEVVRYNENRSFLEDMELISHLILRSMRCMYTPLRFYAYRKLTTSASNVPKVKNLKDSFEMCDVFHDLSNQTTDLELKNMFMYNSIMMYYWTLETIASDPYYKNRKQIIDTLSLFSRQKQVSLWARKDTQHYPIHIHISPRLGVILFRIKRTILIKGSFIKQTILKYLK